MPKVRSRASRPSARVPGQQHGGAGLAGAFAAPGTHPRDGNAAGGTKRLAEPRCALHGHFAERGRSPSAAVPSQTRPGSGARALDTGPSARACFSCSRWWPQKYLLGLWELANGSPRETCTRGLFHPGDPGRSRRGCCQQVSSPSARSLATLSLVSRCTGSSGLKAST